MLRPATPLSLFLAAAFALLLLSVLSAPVISAIPLGTFKDASFGVFGYCNSAGCSSAGIGYDVGKIVNRNPQAFELPANVRNSLTSILILHPIAAFLTLVMFILAVTAHAHAPSHSARYLLILFIFTLLDFLVCLAAFVVDVLLFIPHMAWGTYVVLAATILVLLSALVTCAMRRTLVSRKSRKKKIAENAEMSGENYYNRENQVPKATFALASEPTVPVVSGANGTFATFDTQKKDDQVSDERIPLTQRTGSDRSPSTVHAMTTDIANAGEVGSAYSGPMRSASQDRYGNYANAPPDAYGAANASPYDRMNRRQNTDPNAYPAGYAAGGYRGGRGGGYGPARGRGGYGPPGRGAYGPRGGGRGGYGPSPRGAYGAGNMMGGGRSPPPGYNTGGQYDTRQYTDPQQEPYGGRQPPSSDPSINYSAGSRNGGYSPYNPNLDLPRAESPPPLPGSVSAVSSGQAIEMDATPSVGASNVSHYGQIRDSDTDVAGMVGLQQGRGPERRETYASDGSKYEEEQYVPVRTAWNQNSGRNSPRTGSPANAQRGPNDYPGRSTPAAGSKNNGNYYEDIDPRFDQAQNDAARQQQQPLPQIQAPPIEPGDYEELRGAASGARSPAESERSNFTSISQRGINPRWNPPPMPQPGYGPPTRRPVQQRQDMLLDNPDFKLPGGRSAAGSARGNPGIMPGSAYPNGPM